MDTLLESALVFCKKCTGKTALLKVDANMMSSKIGRKDFKSLFGADDSEEDDFLADNQNTAHVQVDDTHDNHNVENTERSESLYKSNSIHNVNKNELVSNNEYQQNDIDDQTRKRRIDIKEVSRYNKRIKFNEENRELNPSREMDSIDAKANENGVKRVEGISDESDSKKNADDKKTRSKKMEVGGLVVKLLTPAYVERRFDSKETFKTLARNISHALANKDEHEIREYIKNFLGRNELFTSQTTL